MMGDAMATMQTVVVTWRRWRRDGTADSDRVAHTRVVASSESANWASPGASIRTRAEGNTRQAADERQRRDPETQRRTQKATSERQREPKTASGGGLRRAADQRGCGGGGGITRRAASIVAAVRA
jgi:hypothetical protein